MSGEWASISYGLANHVMHVYQFCVCVILHSRKAEAKQVSRDGIDVFLPYEQALFITDASPEHVLLLNKYPQLPLSLVIPTKKLVPQVHLLSSSVHDRLLEHLTRYPFPTAPSLL